MFYKRILDDFINKMPTELDDDERKLFNAIMQIADNNDALRSKIKEIKKFLNENAYFRDEEDVLHKGLTDVEIDELVKIVEKNID